MVRYQTQRILQVVNKESLLYITHIYGLSPLFMVHNGPYLIISTADPIGDYILYYMALHPPSYAVTLPLSIPTIQGSLGRNFWVTNASITSIITSLHQSINTLPRQYLTSLQHFTNQSLHNFDNTSSPVKLLHHFSNNTAHLNHYITTIEASHQSLHHLTHCITSIIASSRSLHHCLTSVVSW